MTGNLQAFLKVYQSSFLSRKELEEAISSKSIDEAVKNIIAKPIGAYLYGEKRVGVALEVSHALNLIDRFENKRIKTILQKLPGKTARKTKIFIGLMDSINAYLAASNLVNNGTPRYLFPTGSIPENIVEGHIHIDRLPRDIRLFLEGSVAERRVSLLQLMGLLPPKKLVMSLPFPSRIIYGDLHDLFMLKLCHLEKINPPYLVLMDRAVFSDVCNVEGLDKLFTALERVNPYLNAISKVSRTIMEHYSGSNIIELSSILYAVSRANTLLTGNDNLAVRGLILSVGEGIILKYIFIAIDSGYFKDTITELVREVWPI